MQMIPIDDDDIAAARALRVEFARFWSTEQGTPRDVYDRFVAATAVVDGVTVQPATTPATGLWVRPQGRATDDVLLFVHGGGYGLGSAHAYAGLVSELVTRIGTAAFVLDYPLAPEAQLPQALDLAVETLHRLCAEHRSVVVAGDSAGGGLALATLAEVTRRGVAVAAAAVFSPWTDLSLSGESVHRFAVGDPLLDVPYLRASAAAYLGSAHPEDPRASPLFDISGDRPPVLVQVGSDEILLDDSRRFAVAVANAGGAVRLEVWQGMHHVFQLNVAQLAAARLALDSAGSFLVSQLSDAGQPL